MPGCFAPLPWLAVMLSALSPVRRRRPAAPCAAVPAQAVEHAAPASTVPAGLAQLTWLENNGWIWEVAGVRVLVDPWLVAELDFNIPLFYSAKKRATSDLTVSAQRLPTWGFTGWACSNLVEGWPETQRGVGLRESPFIVTGP